MMKKGTICKKYTQEEKNFIIENYKTMTSLDISKIIDRTKASVIVMAGKLGLGESSKDLISGQKFNRLTIIKKTDKRTKCRAIIYECLCICGNITYVPRNTITSGHTKSCGCLQIEKISESLLLSPGKATINQLYYCCKGDAQKRGIDFLLTMEQHAEIVSHDCNYCGEPPRKANYLIKKDGNLKKVKHIATKSCIDNSWAVANTVDRIDSNKAYTLDNCVAACWPCNQMKMISSVNDFISQTYKIVAFQESKKK